MLNCVPRLLSKGHPLGATGIANIYEIVTHLRGEAGAIVERGEQPSNFTT